MNLTLDADTEQRIQRELDRGHYSDPAEVIAHALNLLEAQAEWLDRNRQAISDRLDEGYEQIQRGEGISGEKAREMLAERRTARVG